VCCQGQVRECCLGHGCRQRRLTPTNHLPHRRSELISERNNELHRVTAALEDVKQQLESRGSNLSDASPLVRLKAALGSLREELKGMELRIGVVAHNLVSLSLQGKQAALTDAAARGARDVPHKAGGLAAAGGAK
jgi:estrogen-related receptor beta like 1